MKCQRAGCDRTLMPIYGAWVSRLYREVIGEYCPYHEGKWRAKWDETETEQ